MPNGKKKIKKIAKLAGKAVYGATPMGQLENVAKVVQKSARGYGQLFGRVACQKKGGKWVGGKCIPKGSEVRTGKKKYMEARPPGQTYLGRKRSFDPGGRRRES